MVDIDKSGKRADCAFYVEFPRDVRISPQTIETFLPLSQEIKIHVLSHRISLIQG